MRQFDDSFYLNLTITRNTFNNDPNVTVINENLTSNESDPKLSIVKYFNSTSLQIETKTFYLSAADFPYKFSRLIFDQLFNLLILMLIMQMFLSIIKDFFSRKREEHEKFEEYTKKNCLLCGIGREKIERLYMSHKDAFDIHIKRDHNINDVICYLNYLELKNFNELDKNTESEVLKMHKEKKYSYIPKKMY